MIQFDYYFSNGLKHQPVFYIYLFFFENAGVSDVSMIKIYTPVKLT